MKPDTDLLQMAKGQSSKLNTTVNGTAVSDCTMTIQIPVTVK